MPETHPLNLKVLQRHDPSIVSIVDSATYVVLYAYDGEDWIKEGIEGSMFIFKRSISPPLGLFILNRQGLNNWTRPITYHTEFDIQGKVLMMNESAKISGLWVHDEEEGQKLLELLSSLRSSLPEPIPSPPPPPPPAPLPLETNGSLSFAEILARLQSPAVTSAQPTATATSSAPPPPPRGTELLDLLFSSVGEVKSSAAPTPQIDAAFLLPTPPTPSAVAGDSTTDDSSTGGQSPMVPHPTPAALAPSNGGGRQGQQGGGGGGRRSRQPTPSGSGGNAAAAQDEGEAAEGVETTPRRKTRRGHRARGGEGQGRRGEETSQGPPERRERELVIEEVEEEIVRRMTDHRLEEAATTGAGVEGGEVLDRYEFVRQLMGLLRSDPPFVDRLYASYVNQSHP